ncbi:Histidine kinase [Acanthopleuribacter pedis]|nr:chemotaxis protein CheA [Acanthopleuribacter pedis]
MIDFIDESMESLAVIPGYFVNLESNPNDLGILESVFRPIHSLKGNAAYFGLLKLKALAHELESLLDLLRKGRLTVTKAIIDALLAGVDEIIEILDRTRIEGNESLNEASYRKALDRVLKILETTSSAAAITTNTQDLWQTGFAILEKVTNAPILTGSDERERLLELSQILSALSKKQPEGAAAATPSPKEQDINADHPIEGLRALAGNLGEKLAENERAGRIRTHLAALSQAALSDETRQLVNQASEEFDLFFNTIGFDPMLTQSLLEAADQLAEQQSWHKPSETPATETTPAPAEAAPPGVQEPPLAAPAREAKPEVAITQPPPAEAATIPEPTPPVEVEAAAEKTNAEAERRESKEAARSMRVSEEAIDAFLEFVGELIAVDEMFRYIHAELVNSNAGIQITSSLLRVINTFTKLSDDLQRSIMEIRKVSAKGMLQKTQRIVRDVASVQDKQINAVVSGLNTRIDRSLIETLEAPLVHMVRNAADHGIEPPEIRRSNGKPESGEIEVAMHEENDMVVLSVRDDGKGLDLEAIRQKAVNNGIIGEDDQVTNELLVNFIFSSGFSTAKQVTEISGRGVGMDAVKKGVEQAGGTIEVDTEPGKGSRFTIKLPSSVGTQILESFVVKVGGERFIVPMERISGSFRPDTACLSRLPNGNVCVKRKEDILPILSLSGLYRGDFQSLANGILVTIESRISPFALLVDTIIGLQKVVLRAIPWIFTKKFVGAAVMGDGRVSMIVDLNALEDYLIDQELSELQGSKTGNAG